MWRNFKIFLSIFHHSLIYKYILCLDVIWGKSQISVLLLKRIIKRSTLNVFEQLEFICTLKSDFPLISQCTTCIVRGQDVIILQDN